MNYIAEINRFHELLPQSRMTPSSIALRYGLMHILNKESYASPSRDRGSGGIRRPLSGHCQKRRGMRGSCLL